MQPCHAADAAAVNRRTAHVEHRRPRSSRTQGHIRFGDKIAIHSDLRFCAGFWTPAIPRRSAGSTDRRPKSAKARSRGKCGTRQGNERYEDRMSAPLSMVSATRARGDVHLCIPGNRGEYSGHFGGRAECSNGRLTDLSTSRHFRFTPDSGLTCTRIALLGISRCSVFPDDRLRRGGLGRRRRYRKGHPRGPHAGPIFNLHILVPSDVEIALILLRDRDDESDLRADADRAPQEGTELCAGTAVARHLLPTPPASRR